MIEMDLRKKRHALAWTRETRIADLFWWWFA